MYTCMYVCMLYCIYIHASLVPRLSNSCGGGIIREPGYEAVYMHACMGIEVALAVC